MTSTAAAAFGAQLRGNSTQFRLWAPARAEMTLEISGFTAIAMQRDQHGFFLRGGQLRRRRALSLSRR